MVDPPLTDARDQLHEPAGSDVRIVSLVPSLTELVFALGLGDRVVGRTAYCVHPSDRVDAVPVVGGTKKPSLGTISELEPTHVLVNVDENRREDVDAIEELGARVIVTHPLGPRDNHDLFRLLGGIFGAQDRARQLREQLDAVLAGIEAAAETWPDRRVLYLIWRKPWMTVSRDTYISRMLSLGRLHTLPETDGERYPTLTDDHPVWREAELVLLSTEPYPFTAKHLPEVRVRLPEPPPAVRFIDAEMVSWYGNRAIPGIRYVREFVGDVAAAAS